MKELSVEEKARRYDEALKVANKYEDIHIMFPSIKDEMFPELKESEGEMIRKEMIETLKNEAHEFPSSIIAEKSKSWIAWLEKQVHSDFRSKIYVSDKVTRTPSFDEAQGTPIIKQCEQEEMDYNEELKKCKANPLYFFDKYVNVKLKEQKQEWSEEDELTRNALINLVEMYYGGCIDKSEKNRLLDWLKSLKGRVQPRQKWSEEDENMLKFILTDYRTRGAKEDSDIITWLKSLNSQSHWKPSDEQIKGIECAIKTLQYQLNVGDKRLDSLYGDLKKLREE